MNTTPSAKHRLLFSTVTLGVIVSILAAAGDALELPLTKLFFLDSGVFMSLAFLFFGGVAGMLLTLLFGRKSKAVFDPARHLQKKDTGKLLGVVGFTILANVLVLTGLQQEAAGAASILQNVTVVTTVILAFFYLKEKISKRLGIGVSLIVLGSVALSITNVGSLSFSTGSLFIIAGYLSYGFLYAVQKLLSDRNPAECNFIRCSSVGVIALIVAFCLGEQLPSLPNALGLMFVGLIVNGISNMFLQYGQRYLGAAKAGAVFGLSPLLGVFFAIPILGEMPSPSLLAALILFIPGMYFVITKHTGNTAEKTADAAVREDAEYIRSISEEKKTGMRNQLTSFGFLIVAMFFVMMVLGVF
ncbi:MAG: DMT family transporter, partial [Methanocorpusculum sp.]|nr:DMT family transporter [Methanocorpusculum sp.]